MEQGKIDSTLAILLLSVTIYSTTILTVPSFAIKHAKQDAWISIIFAIALSLIIAKITVNLSVRFQNKTIFQYPEEILGKVLGKIIVFLYLWWFLHLTSEVAREMGDFLASELMPETPLLVFIIIIVCIAGYAAYNGLEVIARVVQLLFPVLGLLFILYFLSLKDMKITRLLPVFDSGIAPILKGAIVPTGWLGEIFMISVIIPYLSKPKETQRVALFTVLISGFILVISVLIVILTLGIYMGSSSLYPNYSVVRTISIAKFLERMDYFAFVAWVLGGLIKIAFCYYSFALGSAQVLGLKDYRPLIIPVGIIIVALSILLHENIVDALSFYGIWSFYSMMFTFIMPSIMSQAHIYV